VITKLTGYAYVFSGDADDPPSSVVEVASPMPAHSFAMTVPTNPMPILSAEEHRNNVLSLFSPLNVSPRSSPNGSPEAVASSGLALTNGIGSAGSKPGTPSMFAPEIVPPAPAPGVPSNGVAAASPQHLRLIDEDIPLLSDSEGYTFGDGEEVQYRVLLDLLRSNGETYSWDVAPAVPF
jgi:hypothetical protein